jgi:hypothetical protein
MKLLVVTLTKYLLKNGQFYGVFSSTHLESVEISDEVIGTPLF